MSRVDKTSPATRTGFVCDQIFRLHQKPRKYVLVIGSIQADRATFKAGKVLGAGKDVDEMALE